MLRRSAFKRAQFERPARSPLVPLERPPVIRQVSADAVVVAVPKDQRSMQTDADQKRLYGHVASLPCARCWREGRTQVSHSNQLIDGKGRGLKAYPWRIAALCDECHPMIDQGKDMSKSERIAAWNAAHRTTLGWLFEKALVRPV